MTYEEFDALFFKKLGNGREIVYGKAVEALYMINREADGDGKKTIDEQQVKKILKKYGVADCFFDS